MPGSALGAGILLDIWWRTCCSSPPSSCLLPLNIWSCFVVQAGLDLTIVAQAGFQNPHPPASSFSVLGPLLPLKLATEGWQSHPLPHVLPALCVNKHIWMKRTDYTKFLYLNGWFCLDRRYKDKCSFKDKLNWFEMNLRVKEDKPEREEPEQNNRGKKSPDSEHRLGGWQVRLS